jgi:alanine-glyoxylate transaminase/serine-glyoxylate transaminase/serine-pyruvate transaminase
MTLRHGRPYLAIPGPSVIPDRVLNAMHRAAPNIYSGELVEMMPGLVRDLKSVARTVTGEVAIYIANGHGAWEAAVANVFSPGDRALVLATGRFALGWADIARRMGVEVEIIDFGKRAPVDLDRVAGALRAHTGHAYKAVMLVQVDTASSVKNDIRSLRDLLDSLDHPALLMVDCIACLACDPFEMDGWGVDVMVAACQKGLMTPPGLGFVAYSAKADRARDTARCVTHYWDWRPRTDPSDFYQYFDGTAPTHHLYGLRAALDMIGEEGLEAVWRRHGMIARAVWAAFETWGQEGPVELNIADPALRSHAVTAVRAGGPEGTALRTWVEEKAGLTLGIGLGMAEKGDPAWHNFFRVGHMGHVNAHMIMGALGAIEAGMRAVGLPFAPGGLSAAAQVLSDA